MGGKLPALWSTFYHLIVKFDSNLDWKQMNCMYKLVMYKWNVKKT